MSISVSPFDKIIKIKKSYNHKTYCLKWTENSVASLSLLISHALLLKLDAGGMGGVLA